MTVEPLDAGARVDGRRQRSERSRDAVVEALLAFYADGVTAPGAAEIAARAGVSERSVFRHFEDLEGLARAAIERQWERVGVLYAAPERSGSRDERIEALVQQRLRLYEAIKHVARAALALTARSTTLSAEVGARRRLLRTQVEAQFEPELSACAPRDAADLLAALDSAASFDTIRHLREGAGLSKARTRAVVSRTLSALLEQEERCPST